MSKTQEVLDKIIESMKENEGEIQYGLAFRKGRFYKPMPERWKQSLGLSYPKEWKRVTKPEAIALIKERSGLSEVEPSYKGGLIRVKVVDRNNLPSDTYYKGEIYKGFGIVKWLSAGRQAPFCIHLDTGRIIPKLTGGADGEFVKSKIELVKDHIDASMDYEEINKVLDEKFERDLDKNILIKK